MADLTRVTLHKRHDPKTTPARPVVADLPRMTRHKRHACRPTPYAGLAVADPPCVTLHRCHDGRAPRQGSAGR